MKPGPLYTVVYHEGGRSLDTASRAQAYHTVDLLNRWPDLAPRPMAVIRWWPRKPLDQACGPRA